MLLEREVQNLKDVFVDSVATLISLRVAGTGLAVLSPQLIYSAQQSYQTNQDESKMAGRLGYSLYLTILSDLPTPSA